MEAINFAKPRRLSARDFRLVTRTMQSMSFSRRKDDSDREEYAGSLRVVLLFGLLLYSIGIGIGI
jgi:hypothetical protein